MKTGLKHNLSRVLFLTLVWICFLPNSQAKSCYQSLIPNIFIQLTPLKIKKLFSQKINIESFYQARTQFSSLEPSQLVNMDLSSFSREEQIALYESLVQKTHPNSPQWTEQQINAIAKITKSWARDKPVKYVQVENLFFYLYLAKHFRFFSFKNWQALLTSPNSAVISYLRDFYYHRLVMKGFLQTMTEMNVITVNYKIPFWRKWSESFLLKIISAYWLNVFAFSSVGLPVDSANSSFLNQKQIQSDLNNTEDLLPSDLETSFMAFQKKYFWSGATDYYSLWTQKSIRIIGSTVLLSTLLWGVLSPVIQVIPDYVLHSKPEMVASLLEAYEQDAINSTGQPMPKELRKFLEKKLLAEKSLWNLTQKYHNLQ
ncbi:MAG: hypothetical protein KDD40_04980 [Bdellovibrionales bacterium]|nr:hypothetical protein [Bdellovibrionales bacterium]